MSSFCPKTLDYFHPFMLTVIHKDEDRAVRVSSCDSTLFIFCEFLFPLLKGNNKGNLATE